MTQSIHPDFNQNDPSSDIKQSSHGGNAFLSFFPVLALPPLVRPRGGSDGGRGRLAHLGLLVLREDGAHGCEEKVRDVAPQLVGQHAEVGHRHVDVRLPQRDYLWKRRTLYSPRIVFPHDHMSIVIFRCLYLTKIFVPLTLVHSC